MPASVLLKRKGMAAPAKRKTMKTPKPRYVLSSAVGTSVEKAKVIPSRLRLKDRKKRKRARDAKSP